jgi:uroporphyrinogen-III synthase
MNPLIIITRPLDHGLETAQRVRSLGFTPLPDPVLVIRRQEWTAPDWTAFTALLITSGNALAALIGRDVPKDKPLFVVGEKTAAAAKAAGFQKIVGVAEKSADLPNLIPQALPKGLLLHLTSEDAHTGFQKELETAGYPITQLIVYKAWPVEELSAATRQALLENRVEGALFYSARSATVFLHLLTRHGLEWATQHMQAFCLSQAVADAASAATWKKIHIAASPTENSLLDKLAKAYAEGHHPPTPLPGSVMQNPPPSFMPPPPYAEKKSHLGVGIAVIALMFSCAALGVSLYALAYPQLGLDDKVITPLVRETSVDEEQVRAAVSEALAAQQKNQTNTLEALNAELENLKSRVAAPVEQKPATLPVEIQQKLAEIDNRTATSFKSLAALVQLEHIGLQAQSGLSFSDDLEALRKNIAQRDDLLPAFLALKSLKDKPLASDATLLHRLHRMAPQMLADEKLKQSNNFMDKMTAQLQKLVVIRAKDGTMMPGTPTANAVQGLENAVIAGDYAQAATLADALNAHAPPEFAAWVQDVKTRADIAAHLRILREGLLDNLETRAAPSSAGAAP